VIYFSYNAKRVELQDNCGTGAGGFKSGNTCATKRSGILGGNKERLFDIVQKEGLLDKVKESKIKEYAQKMYEEIGKAKIKEAYGKTPFGKIQNWLDTDDGSKLKSAVAKSLKYYGRGSIGALKGINNDKFQIIGTAFASPAIFPLVLGESVIKGFFGGVVKEYQRQAGEKAVQEAVRSGGMESIASKIQLQEQPDIKDVIDYLTDVLAVSIREFIEDKKKFEKLDFSDNCGTGAGGFKEGNTCAGKVERGQPQYIKDQIKRQEQLILNLEKKLKEPSQVEHLYAVSKDGTLILSKTGNKNSVEVEGDSIKKMQEDGNAIVTHSHPAKSSLSWADIVFASEVNLREIRAVAGEKTYIAKRPKSGWPEKEKIIDRHNETNNRLYRILKPRLSKETKALSDNWEKLPMEERNYSTLKKIYTKYNEFHSEALSSYVLRKLGVPFSIQKK
jgi:hypothetical protein